MGSLTDLNTFSNNILPFTDNRPPGILLSYPIARNVPAVTRTGTSFDVQRNIDIVEIIDPNGTLNLTYSIDLSSVAGAYISWTTLFGGAITSSVGNVYSVSVIDSISDWELVRAPLITIPADFQGTFEYSCSLEYNTGSNIETVSWTVGSFVPVSNLQGIFTTSITPTKFKGIVDETLDCGFTISGIGADIDFAEATLPVVFDVDADVERLVRGYEATLPVVANISSSFTYVLGGLSSVRVGTFAVSCDAELLEPFSNYSPTRTYDANAWNRPFASNPMTVRSAVVSAIESLGQFSVSVSTNDGLLYHEDNSETNKFGTRVTLSGSDVQDVLDEVAKIEFYPDYNDTGNEIYNIEVYSGSKFWIEEDVTGYALNYSGTTRALESRITVYKQTTGSGFPVHPYAVQYMNEADIHIIGGGGAGSVFNGGGAGNAHFKNDSNWTLSKMQAASISAIGAGGTWDGLGGAADSGGSTTATYDSINYTLGGGTGGLDPTGTGGNTQSNLPSANSFYTGGSEFSFTDSFGQTQVAGGSGAGITADGKDGFQSGDNAEARNGGNGRTVSFPFDGADNTSHYVYLQGGNSGNEPYTTDITAHGGSGFSTTGDYEYSSRDFSRLVGAGGHAGNISTGNSDGYNHGIDGGVIINYFRFG